MLFFGAAAYFPAMAVAIVSMASLVHFSGIASASNSIAEVSSSMPGEVSCDSSPLPSFYKPDEAQLLHVAHNSIPSFIEHAIRLTLANLASSMRNKDKGHVAKIVTFLNEHGKFEELAHLIKVVPSGIGIWSVLAQNDHMHLVFRMTKEIPSSVLANLNHFSLTHLVVMLLAPMDNDTFAPIQSLLEEKYPVTVISEMISVASDESFERYFVQGNEDIYHRNMRLLTCLETRGALDQETRLQASFVRILYAIRLGSEDSAQLAESIMALLVVDDDELKDLIEGLTRKLVITAISSERFDLLTTLQQKLGRATWFGFSSRQNSTSPAVSHLLLEKLFSDDMYTDTLKGAAGAFKLVRAYKKVTGHYPDEKCIERFYIDFRVSIIAEIYGEDRFQAAIHKFFRVNDNLRLARVARDIGAYCSNPVPFISFILRCIREQITLSYGWSGFLRALICSHHDGTAIDVSQLKLDDDFFEALLRDKTLVRVFDTPSGHGLKSCIIIEPERIFGSLLQRGMHQVVELFIALGNPVAFNNDSFNPSCSNDSEFVIFFELFRFENLTLEKLETLYQRPGFWAYLAHMGVGDTLPDTDLQAFESDSLVFSPLSIATFELFITWLFLNPESLIRLADWRIVTALYAAVPNRDFIVKAQCDKYPASLAYVIKNHLQKQSVSLTFPSEYEKEKFMMEVLPAINLTLSMAHCTMNCSVDGS